MSRTKSFIVETFMQLLDEKPLTKITVKDIVERCGVNRNTFYYYFHDIPELMSWTMKEWVDQIIRDNQDFASPADCTAAIVRQGLAHKQALLHIYRSLPREAFLQHLDRAAEYIVGEYIANAVRELPVSRRDQELLTHYYKCLLVGMTLDWMGKGMSYDPTEEVMRIGELMEGSGKRAFLKSGGGEAAQD